MGSSYQKNKDQILSFWKNRQRGFLFILKTFANISQNDFLSWTENEKRTRKWIKQETDCQTLMLLQIILKIYKKGIQPSIIKVMISLQFLLIYLPVISFVN